MKNTTRMLCTLILATLAACGEDLLFDDDQQTNNTNPDPGTQPGPTGPPSDPDPKQNKVSATLRWDIPSLRENGDELLLSEIGGYELVYRLTSVSAYTTVTIGDQTVSEYAIDNLIAGQYEFLIATFDSDGLYSEFSDPIVATFQ